MDEFLAKMYPSMAGQGGGITPPITPDNNAAPSALYPTMTPTEEPTAGTEELAQPDYSGERWEQVPSDPGGYEITVQDADPELVGWFRNTALEQGLSKRQAAQLVNAYEARVQEAVKAENEAFEAQQAAAVRTLESTWGPLTQEHIQQAQAAVSDLERSIPGLRNWFNRAGLGNDPMMVRLVQVIARRTGNSGNPLDKLYRNS